MPSLIAFVVTSFLEQHFEDFVDMGFTAEMEKRLDQVSLMD
jgi:DNA topoisomerase IA